MSETRPSLHEPMPEQMRWRIRSGQQQLFARDRRNHRSRDVSAQDRKDHRKIAGARRSALRQAPRRSSLGLGPL